MEKKLLVPAPGNTRISEKSLFPGAGTSKNEKNGLSRMRERGKIIKTNVPDPGNN
jgi:hypothetical protein